MRRSCVLADASKQRPIFRSVICPIASNSAQLFFLSRHRLTRAGHNSLWSSAPNSPIGTRTRNRIRTLESGALPACPFPARTLIIYLSCSVFICALRSLYSALKSIPLHNIFKNSVIIITEVEGGFSLRITSNAERRFDCRAVRARLDWWALSFTRSELVLLECILLPKGLLFW